jgi:hypothetical protein
LSIIILVQFFHFTPLVSRQAYRDFVSIADFSLIPGISLLSPAASQSFAEKPSRI